MVAERIALFSAIFFSKIFFLPYLDKDIQVTNFESGRPTSLRDVRYEEACNRLAVEAVKRGCTDNVTVMIVDISQPSSTKDSQETVTVVKESSWCHILPVNANNQFESFVASNYIVYSLDDFSEVNCSFHQYLCMYIALVQPSVSVMIFINH